MAVRRALGLWGRVAGQEAAALCSEALSQASVSSKARTLCTQSTAATSWHQASSLQVPAAAWRIPPACGATCSTAATASRLRHLSTAREGLQETAHRLKSAASSTADALKAASGAVGRAPRALYDVLPASAKQLVTATQTPGAVNRVISLQLTAFWQNHSSAIIAVGAAALCYATWRALHSTSQAFVDLSSATATAGFFALSAALVASGYLYLRRRYSIDPQSVYRLAMYRLNTHPGLLEVMGAPLVGSPAQASVLTGGGISFRGLRPRLHSKRIQMIFPLKGAERRGLVSLEAKKRHGQLRFKLLAVDVPCVGGAEQRIFLEGGPALYDRGGVLPVLRDPFIRALSMEEVFLAEDEAEDAQEQREAAAAAAARQAARAAKQPKPLDQGGGMYFHEKVALNARQAYSRLFGGEQKQQPLQPVGPAAEPGHKAAPVAAAAGAA